MLGQSQTNGEGHVPYLEPDAMYAQGQWLFMPAELLKSPSILEGLSMEQELANRQKGVNFITQVGIMLKLPQLTLATASVFLHRFYMRYPMQVSKDKGIHHYQAAATALFLATKVEENCRKMKELIVACCRVAQKDPNSFIDEQSKEYWKWRDTILFHEDLLLEALCFDLQLEKPYQILFDYLRYYGVQEQKNLRNTSWAFLNDSHITTMCLLYSPKTIAGAALYAGIRLAGMTLPDDEHGQPWWAHLDLDIKEIAQACNQMADIYENSNIPRKGQKDAYTRDEDPISFERTRRTQSPSLNGSPAHSIRSASQGLKRDREDSWGHEHKNGHDDTDVSNKASVEDHGSAFKRQRNDSGPSEVGSRASRVRDGTQNTQPASTSSQTAVITPSTRPDEVQQRIDAIVNGPDVGHASHGRSAHGGVAPPDHAMNNPDQRRPTSRVPQTSEIKNLSQQKSTAENGTHNSQAQTSIPTTADMDAFKHGGASKDADYGSEEGEV